MVPGGNLLFQGGAIISLILGAERTGLISYCVLDFYVFLDVKVGFFGGIKVTLDFEFGVLLFFWGVISYNIVVFFGTE